MNAFRWLLLLIAVASYAATCVGLCVRATDHEHKSPRSIERRGPEVGPPYVPPQRKGAGEYNPGPVPLQDPELVKLRAVLRDHAAGLRQ